MPRILPPPTITQSDIGRFTGMFRRTGSCWMWTGQLTDAGYGVFRFGRQRYGAHRISYTIHTGTYPTGIICHKCDNPACVNPDHLYDGTHLDNTKDRQILERHAEKTWLRSASPLEPEVFSAIRWEYECFLGEMMDKFGLQRNAIHRVVAKAYTERKKG